MVCTNRKEEKTMHNCTNYLAAKAELMERTKVERDLIANLSNASAILNLYMDEINWVGFYLVKGRELVLGPFQGRPACVRIECGRGVCGTALAKDEIQLVADVHAFPGHIACDQRSRSEIVLPIHANGRVVGVLDIDSPIPERFSGADAEALKEFMGVLEEVCDWNLM